MISSRAHQRDYHHKHTKTDRLLWRAMHALRRLPRPVQALVLAILLLAVVLAGVVRAASEAERLCGGRHCALAILALVTPVPEGEATSGHNPCTDDPGCGSGALLALSSLLLVAIAASQLAGQRPSPGGRVRPAAQRLQGVLLVWCLERPPRLPA